MTGFAVFALAYRTMLLGIDDVVHCCQVDTKTTYILSKYPSSSDVLVDYELYILRNVLTHL